MNIGILGTGMVGQALAEGLSQAGHSVMMGTRDPDGRHAPDGVALVAPEQACNAGLVINALNGGVCVGVLESLTDELTGKVLLDVANPLDFSAGFPPTLFTEQTESLAERIQWVLPATAVIKSLNTLTAPLMLNPGALPAPSAVFLSGDDVVAKQLVRDLLTSFGWEQIIDLGGLATARGVEMLMPMWLTVMQAMGDAQFNWAVIR